MNNFRKNISNKHINTLVSTLVKFPHTFLSLLKVKTIEKPYKSKKLNLSTGWKRKSHL